MKNRLPRIRGDRPIDIIANSQEQAATPHTRGSTSDRVTGRMFSYGYPAYAGIDLDGDITTTE